MCGDFRQRATTIGLPCAAWGRRKTALFSCVNLSAIWRRRPGGEGSFSPETFTKNGGNSARSGRTHLGTAFLSTLAIEGGICDIIDPERAYYISSASRRGPAQSAHAVWLGFFFFFFSQQVIVCPSTSGQARLRKVPCLLESRVFVQTNLDSLGCVSGPTFRRGLKKRKKK